MDVLEEFSERLAELMLLNDIKSEKLGAELNINGSTIRKWLRCENQINLPYLARVADYFGCTMDYLAGRSDEEMTFVPQPLPPFPEALRKIMRLCGYTRYRLHTTTKFKDSYIYGWDHGSPPTLTSLIELANLFGTTIDHLVGRDS